MIVAFAAFVIAAVICVAVFLEWLHAQQRRANIESLRDAYADAQRRHAPREHIRRELVLAVCRELRS